jgi:hypothetical protein
MQGAAGLPQCRARSSPPVSEAVIVMKKDAVPDGPRADDQDDTTDGARLTLLVAKQL